MSGRPDHCASCSCFDMRNWQRREPVFESFISVGSIAPDEADLVEVGPRVACALVKDSVRDWVKFPYWVYRR